MLLIGPAGSGKSLLALHFALAAIHRGETVAMFVFDEELGSWSIAPVTSASI